MLGTLIAYAPLVACPLGMAAMMGIPALMYRAKRRRQDTDPNRPQEGADLGASSDVSVDLSDKSTDLPPAHDVARRDALAGSIAVKS
jgi:hypothetical protein